MELEANDFELSQIRQQERRRYFQQQKGNHKWYWHGKGVAIINWKKVEITLHKFKGVNRNFADEKPDFARVEKNLKSLIFTVVASLNAQADLELMTQIDEMIEFEKKLDEVKETQNLTSAESHKTHFVLVPKKLPSFP